MENSFDDIKAHVCAFIDELATSKQNQAAQVQDVQKQIDDLKQSNHGHRRQIDALIATTSALEATQQTFGARVDEVRTAQHALEATLSKDIPAYAALREAVDDLVEQHK